MKDRDMKTREVVAILYRSVAILINGAKAYFEEGEDWRGGGIGAYKNYFY
jgi:hypothetical protein